jgi:hypothetical protein
MYSGACQVHTATADEAPVLTRVFGGIVSGDGRDRRESELERSRVRSGCLSLVVRIGVVSVAAVLAALSTALILSFAVSALGQPDGIERIISVLVASSAGLVFFLVGRSIWRDLRRGPSAEPESKESSAEEGQ